MDNRGMETRMSALEDRSSRHDKAIFGFQDGDGLYVPGLIRSTADVKIILQKMLDMAESAKSTLRKSAILIGRLLITVVAVTTIVTLAHHFGFSESIVKVVETVLK